MKKLMTIILAVGLTGCATTPTQSNADYRYHNRPQYTSRPVYAQSYQQPVYTQSYSQPVYTQSQPVQEDYNKKVLKQGLLGAATGAIAAGASGGKAGTGALIGAGTNVVGGALLDYITSPQPQQTQYAPYANQWNQQNPNTSRVVRRYDSSGNVISEQVYRN